MARHERALRFPPRFRSEEMTFALPRSQLHQLARFQVAAEFSSCRPQRQFDLSDLVDGSFFLRYFFTLRQDG